MVGPKMAERMLQKYGHEVTIADNGKEALAALQSRDFDLILMDIQMPHLDGFQATEAIRRKEEKTGAHIPIVAMTAHAMKEDRGRCLAAGMDDYICKPIKPDLLMEVIQRVMNRAKELSA